MTPESLDKALVDGNVKLCLRLLRNQPESVRRSAAKVALKNIKQAQARWISTEVSRRLFQRATDWTSLHEAAAVGILGTATLGEIRRLPRSMWLPLTHAYEVLTNRHPDWLSEWAEWILESDPRGTFGSGVNGWLVVRRLIRDGFIDRPLSDSYVTGMIGCYHPHESVRVFLNTDPNMLEYEVWRLFEVEGDRNASLASQDKYSRPENTWSAALLGLSGEDRLDRQRLLTASLDALQRDFAPFRAGWFSRFHEDLEPSVDERAERAGAYFALLSSRVPATVSFALKSLSLLEKAGRLNLSAEIDEFCPILMAREKGSVSIALRLLDRAASRHGSAPERVAIVASHALAHPAPDIQKRALRLIEKHGSLHDPALRAELEARREDGAASVAPRLREILSESASEPANTKKILDDSLTEELLKRAAKLDPCWAERAGVTEALTALSTGTLPTRSLSLSPLQIPRLASDRKIHPITDLDSLIDTFLSVMENEGPPDEIERVLDGVSRLCGERPPDFDRRTSALRKRARSIVGEDPLSGVSVAQVAPSLAGLALAWAEGTPMPMAFEDASLFGFFHRRVIEIGLRASVGRAGELLAAPTHAGGWIDPRVATARLQARGFARIAGSSEPESAWKGVLSRLRTRLRPDKHPRDSGDGSLLDRFDVIQCFLRLAPDGRAEALTMAEIVPGEVGEALRYALGGTGTRIGSDVALWIAAARAREPLTDHPEIESRFPGRGPGAGCGPRISLQWKPRTESAHVDPVLTCDPECPRKISPDIPTVMHFAWRKDWYRWDFFVGKAMETLINIWPPGRAYWFAYGACTIGDNIDWWEARWGDASYLALAADPDTMLNSFALDMVTFGLAARESGQAAAATDVIIAGVLDGRVTGMDLGGALARAIRVQKIIPKRWARSLGDAARVSSLLTFTVRDAIERLLASRPDRKPAEMVTILELANELCAVTGVPICDPRAVAWLEEIKGTGKSAGLSRSLREMAATPVSRSTIRDAALETLRARVERAERWQRA